LPLTGTPNEFRILFLRCGPEFTALVVEIVGFLAQQTKVESCSEPAMSEQIFYFFGLHSLQPRLQVPDVPHRQRETLGNSEMLAGGCNDLLTSAVHRLNRRLILISQLTGAALSRWPIEGRQEKSGSHRSLVGDALIGVAEGERS
jgi:hypothetical protein